MTVQTPTERLKAIAEKIEQIDDRVGSDYRGSIPPREITPAELGTIYNLARGPLKINPLCPHCNRTIVGNSVYAELRPHVRIITAIDDGVLQIGGCTDTILYDMPGEKRRHLFCLCCRKVIELDADMEVEYV